MMNNASARLSIDSLDSRRSIFMIPVSGKVGGKVRKLSFYPHLGLPEVETRIINFGRCNFRCSFCFRGAQHQKLGIVEGSEAHRLGSLFEIADEALAHAQMLKLSGGDPCMEPDVSLALARYMREHGGRVGLAHNGSDPRFCENIAEYLEMAAIDIKAAPQRYRLITAAGGNAARFYHRSLEIIRMLSERGVILDVRTPVFRDTSYLEMALIAEELMREKLDFSRLFWTWRMYEQVDDCSLAPPDMDATREMIQSISQRFPAIMMGLRVKTVGYSKIMRFPL